MSNKNKKNKPIVPYVINMDFDLAGLEGIPEDTMAPQIFCNWVVKSIISFSEQSKGLLIQHHRQAKRIREIFDAEIKTYGTNRKQAVLTEIRTKAKLEGLTLSEVHDFIKLASKARKNDEMWNGMEYMGQISRAEAESAKAVCELEPEDWKFMKQCWDEARHPMQANEVIMRIDGQIREAISNHDRKVNEENCEDDESEKAPEPTSPAVVEMPPPS